MVAPVSFASNESLPAPPAPQAQPQTEERAPLARVYASGYVNYVPGMEEHHAMASSFGAVSLGLSFEKLPDFHSRYGLMYRHSLADRVIVENGQTHTTAFTTFGMEAVMTGILAQKAPDWGGYVRIAGGYTLYKDPTAAEEETGGEEVPGLHIAASGGLAFVPDDLPLEINAGFGYNLGGLWLGATDALIAGKWAGMIPNPEIAVTLKF